MLIFIPRFPSRATGQIFVWDVQTGVVLNNVECWQSGELVFAQTQEIVTLLGKYGTFWTYDWPEGTCIHKGRLTPSSDFLLGAYQVQEESIQLSTSSTIDRKHVVNTWELHLTPDSPPSLIQSFSMPHHDGEFYFSPVSLHASFVTKTQVVILDVHDSSFLLQANAAHIPYVPLGCFSSDGCFFACGTEEPGILVWKNESTNYIPWSNIRTRLPFKGISFSPTTSSILTWGIEGIQLLKLGNQPFTPSPDKVKHHHSNHLVAYSADRTYITTAHHEDNVVTVLTPSLDTPPIDIGMEIMDIKIVNNIVFVANKHMLTQWDLETGERMHSIHGVGKVAIDKPMVISPHTKHLALSDDLSWVAFDTGEMAVFLYDTRATEIVAEYQLVGEVVDIKFSPNQDELWLLTHTMNEYEHPFSLNVNPQILYSLVELEIAVGGGFGNATVKSLEDEWSWVNAFSHGYYIGKSRQWVVDSRGRKLLWLPPNWRVKHWEDVRWNGNFLALVNSHHQGPIIIQFNP